MKLPIVIVTMMVALASGLLRSSYAVTPKQARLDSLLVVAFNKDDTVAIKKLLKAGANIYKEYDWGSLVVHAYFDDSTLFHFLERNGVRITRQTPHGWSILHFLVMEENLFGGDRAHLTPKQLATLLSSKNDVNAISKNGQTPLHGAASNGMFDLVRQLVEHGANVNARDTSGVTPLHLASGKRLVIHTDVVWDGFDRFARVKQTHDSRLRVAAYLIDHGADINAIDHEHNLPLHWYRYDGCDEFVRLALPKGMRLDVRNDDNETVLHTCTEGSEDGSSVAALIAAGMDINARGQFGQTPLHYTLQRNRIETAKKLIAAGADFTIQDELGRTVYQAATQDWQRPEIAKLIRLANGDPDVEVEINPPVQLENTPIVRPKTEVDQVMEEVEKLRKK